MTLRVPYDSVNVSGCSKELLECILKSVGVSHWNILPLPIEFHMNKRISSFKALQSLIFRNTAAYLVLETTYGGIPDSRGHIWW